MIRGIVVDKRHGNLFKMDRHNHVGRCYHGRRPLSDEELRRLYRDEKINLSAPRFAWIDTLFSLPEAALFAEVIEQLEGRGQAVDYARLFTDVRESIDGVHRDDTLKAVVRRDPGRYVVRDPELGPALHKLRSGGKRIFLLTNSLSADLGSGQGGGGGTVIINLDRRKLAELLVPVLPGVIREYGLG